MGPPLSTFLLGRCSTQVGTFSIVFHLYGAPTQMYSTRIVGIQSSHGRGNTCLLEVGSGDAQDESKPSLKLHMSL